MAKTYWQMAQTQGGLASTAFYPPTSFKWVNPPPRKTISGVDVETGKPSVEFTWNALRPQYVHDILNIFNTTDPTVYMTLPKEHNLLTTAARLTDTIDWAVFKGKMSRPTADSVRMGGPSGWRENLVVRVSQVEYVAEFTET